MKRGMLVALLLALTALGLDAAPSSGADSRIQSVSYDPDRVVPLQVADGYALVVELAEDERIDSIVVGNSAVWQVSANKRGDRLVVKPLAGAAVTDMVVTTDTRRYVFTLQPVSESGSGPFVVRFAYPHHDSVPVAVARSAAQYGFRGAKALFPLLMTDDGQRTAIHWGRDTPLPAISAVDDQGREGIVNGRMVDGDYVIEGVAARYIFRRDKAQAVATRRPIEAKRG